MNRAMIALALTIAAAPVATPAQSPAQSSSRDDAALTRLIDGFADAQRRYDPQALAALLAPDYVEVSPIGDVDTREEVLAFYAPDKKRPAPVLTLSEREVRRSGDDAVVVARLSFTVPGPGGATRTVAMRATYVARRIGRDWKLAAAQYTPIRAGGS